MQGLPGRRSEDGRSHSSCIAAVIREWAVAVKEETTRISDQWKVWIFQLISSRSEFPQHGEQHQRSSGNATASFLPLVTTLAGESLVSPSCLRALGYWWYLPSLPAFPPKDTRDNRREKTWKGPKSLRAAAKKAQAGEPLVIHRTFCS